MAQQVAVEPRRVAVTSLGESGRSLEQQGVPEDQALADDVDRNCRHAWQECLAASARYARLARFVTAELGGRPGRFDTGTAAASGIWPKCRERGRGRGQ